MERRISIVGGGLAGLTAAIYAARDGARVTLHERISELGGRARTHEDGGFRFNMGPHALYAKAAARDVLDEIGIEPEGAAPPLAGGAARYAGKMHALPSGLISLMTTGLLSLGEKLELARLLSGLPKLDASRFDGVPLRRAVEQLARNVVVRELLVALVRLSTYTNATDSMCGGSALRQVQIAFGGGVLYLHGGWGRLVESLRAEAVDRGVEIRAGSRVDAVRGIGGGYEVLSEGFAEERDGVVLAVPPAVARDLLEGASGRAHETLTHWCDTLEPVRAACLEIGLSSLPRPKNSFALGVGSADPLRALPRTEGRRRTNGPAGGTRGTRGCYAAGLARARGIAANVEGRHRGKHFGVGGSGRRGRASGPGGRGLQGALRRGRLGRRHGAARRRGVRERSRSGKGGCGNVNAVHGQQRVEDAFQENRRKIFALCYRMTGSAADAEDLVQSTFERALERPPRDVKRPWGPWLVRVAVNLGRDHLRRRRRRAYVGPWLPEPTDTDSWPREEGVEAEPTYEPSDTAGRYDLLESVSFAFLVALEALTPTQRAVLLLRDVLEYSSRETVDALGMSEANVRTTLHRSRKAMAVYDAARLPRPLPDEDARALMGRFMLHMGERDAAAIAELLHDDVLHLADGAGKVSTARIPVRGRERVALLHAGLGKGVRFPRVAFTRLNGNLAILADYPEGAPKPHLARRYAVIAQPAADGRLLGIYFVASEEKLRGVDFEGADWIDPLNGSEGA